MIKLTKMSAKTIVIYLMLINMFIRLGGWKERDFEHQTNYWFQASRSIRFPQDV